MDIIKGLKDKVVVITGGAGVLGAGFTNALAKQGAKVAILGRDLVKAQKLAAEINSAGGKALGVSADVCDEDSLRKAHQEINEQLGLVDILINGAGGNHPKGTSADVFFDRENKTTGLQTFFGLDTEGLRFVFDLNFIGTLLPTQIFAADMIGREGCSILNISSVSAFHPLTKVVAYSAAKAAISNLTEWLSVYFAKEGIRVNALSPGFFLTEQNRTLLTTEDGSLTERGNKILSQTPMGRFGEPNDLDSTLLWLCNPASRFVTGIVVAVDGGFLAYSGV
ncbi:SDR family NAD(P)-dependent oxidoreductase [Flavobacterium sufflavum]|uniref:SDR family NAD(P)-dependent oxidoreductase n=1 Tax=Flavobacterium sufflavum TaxID=1921138 RepID=A0A3S2WH88_9FLAO|nr:SDR family oxidoreductase [Flavobacterium sufflavum]RVT79620.1 SDR family NAD(P)-dependent oxidoreductase [Flavobacterium sufflavum]